MLVDEHLLERCLVNLIGNAAKFTKQGFIEISVQLEPAPDRDEDYMARFEVCDTGIGLSKEASCTILFSQQRLHGAVSLRAMMAPV